MNELQIRALLLECASRVRPKVDWTNPAFPAQNRFLQDPSRFKAAQCTRRAGKSYGVGLMLFEAAYTQSGVSVLYLAKTRDSAKRIMLKDILSKINREKNIRAVLNLTELSLTLPNGSVIYLLGGDANPEEKNKFLGQKFKLVVIDEAAFWEQDLEQMVYEVLAPATIDLQGQIVMVSTTSDIVKGLYYEVTNGLRPEWSVHKWDTSDNPFMRTSWKREIETLTRSNPKIRLTAGFRRMYLNEWVVDDKARVYAFHKSRDLISKIPSAKGQPTFILGIDLGWTDATAFVVTVSFEHDPKLYVVDSHKKSKMIVSDVASWILDAQQLYAQDMLLVVDPGSKQVIEDLRSRYGLNLRDASKSNKNAQIEMLNSDLLTEQVKIVDNAANQALVSELETLTWDARRMQIGIKREDPKAENHLCDAFLYAYRFSKSFATDPERKELHEEDRIELAMEERYRRYNEDEDETNIYSIGDDPWSRITHY